MAVEIPVIVDIQGAFQDAAKNVSSAMRPLQDALSAKTLKLNVPNIGSLKDILKSTTISADDLAEAMAHVKGQMELLNVSGGFLRNGQMTKEARQLTIAYAALEAKLKGGANAVEQAIMSTKRLGSATRETTSAMKAQSPVITNLIASFSAYVSVHSLLRFAKQIRDVTGELEYQRIALGHLIQDEEYGARLFERIKQAAVESPFRIKDLVTYTKQLAAYRIETTQLFDTTKRLADVSAGLGVDMNRLILAYGQVRAASVLRGQELRQFTEAGIPLVELLADKYTELNGRLVTTGEVFEMISKRAVSFSMISEIFQDLTDVGGQFYQMQETQAKTLQGRWEKLKDTFDIALQTIGDSATFRAENDLLIKALEILAKNIRVIPKLLFGATAGWIAYRLATMKARIEEQRAAQTKIKLTAAELRQIVAKQGNTRATRLYTKALIAQRAATSALSKAFWKLAAAMLANPYTAILTGIVALTTAIITFRKKTDEASESASKISEWTDTIERQGQVIGQNKRMETLISRYERLASKTNLTAKEQQALSQTMRVLQGQFKSVNLELGNANNSVSSQVAELKKLNKQQKETAISTLQLTKAQIEQRLTVLGAQEQSQTKEWLAASRLKDSLEGLENLNRRQRRTLKKVTKDYNEYGTALNETSTEINTLQNRLVSIDNILNPQAETPAITAETDRLAKLRQAISDVTNAYKKFLELKEYESVDQALSDIGTLFPSLAGWEPTYENMVKKFEEMLNQYKGDADATRIIEQALANIKFDKIKKDFDDKLKKLSDDIKRSETVRNFYKNMLDLTGDEDLAQDISVSVYGGIGKDFKERLQEQLYRALTELDPGNIDKDLMSQIMGDITIFDIDDIQKNLDKLPPKVREVFEKALEDNQKYNADWLINFEKTYSKAKTYEERVNRLQKQRQQEEDEARRMGKTPDEIAAVTAYFNEKIANVQLEAMKDTYTWTKAFEDLDGVSSRTLNNLISLINGYVTKYGKDLEPQQLKELMRQKEQAKAQLLSRNAFKGVADALKKLNEARKEANRLQKEGAESGEEYNKSLDTQQSAIADLTESSQRLQEYFSAAASSATELMSVFASDENAAAFSEQIEYLSKTISGASKAATGIAQLATGNITPQAVIQTVTGIADMVSGIFGSKNARRIRESNREIERQQDILDRLSYSYSRLEAAQAKAFGSDYIRNYNDQLEILEGQQAAYLAQAEAERNKGKKKDKDKIKDYEDAARDTADKITEMRGQLAEFFTGSDLTSAAKDFANAWIEAYKEFGSTTTAMSEKFNEMIQEMIQNSIAAKVMENMLSPIFKEIDDLAQSGGELTAQEIAQIAADARNTIPAINDAMANLMNQLRAAGYNMRDTAGSFTGISRDIASASEESINGLTQAVNTQNFYFSYVPTISQNVAAILAVISGGSVPTQTAEFTAEGVALPSVQRMVHDHLPNIDANIADMRNMLKSIITPKTAATNTHCVAIK